METQKIQLTSRESQLRNLLLDTARYIDESKETKDKIELRWAGGWVRDKILGLQSHDIDTAINAMTGHRFCEKMRDYLKDKEHMKKHSLTSKDMGGLHRISANPEKSKHLETANTRIYYFDLDFVNLRKETYSEDSRNPQMEFGTAQEDALRRDATINALFYNLHTGLVEDFTGGLEDMKAKRIRTPLEPLTTFTDDPLRVLRLIRFASRLEFTIDTESEAAMSNPSVMEALKLKISRERIGVELDKMLKGKSSLYFVTLILLTMSGNNPRRALELIDQLGLYPTIFTDPTIKTPPVLNPSHWHFTYNCLALLESNNTPGSIYQSLIRSDDAKYLAWILASLTPLSAISNSQLDEVGTRLPLPYATNVAREGIKADNKVCSVVTGAFRNYREIIKLKDAIKRKDSYVTERDTLGLMIRKWDYSGGQWKVQVLFALLVESFHQPGVAGYGTLFAGWQGFIDHMESIYLMDAASIKSILDGKRLQSDLNAGPGPWVKDALNVCMAWQLRNRELAEEDPEKARCEAIEEVRQRREELKIPVKSE